MYTAGGFFACPNALVTLWSQYRYPDGNNRPSDGVSGTDVRAAVIGLAQGPDRNGDARLDVGGAVPVTRTHPAGHNRLKLDCGGPTCGRGPRTRCTVSVI
ncbi:hypothetical protein PGTUg99_004352 [Puccinia graminis f. sp. tritici]|uniref:Uncharacterized protein n=1 Tax=Puccinia graminis f. sp. tritici TaxID=56615 RepID=A0A5B0RHB3_PUCGR|nr:hypothetical protein PGTUg99_004352 [Puccinia graminis f. sp. tritici]